MRRMMSRTAWFIAFLFVWSGQARAQFSMRAASAEPVEGWQRMQLEHSERTVWVAPAAAVVASDIEKAEPEMRATGDRVIRIVFTDAGAEKMRDLTTSQLKKYVALVVDGKLISAPFVAGAFAGKEGILTGNLPSGLSEEEVQRIMASVR